MCRSIKTLRPPFTPEPTEQDVSAAALQYVRKVAGMRAPSRTNEVAFQAAVDAVTASTQALLDALVIRSLTPPVPAGGRSRRVRS